MQQEHSNGGAAAPTFLQVLAPVAAPYLVPLPHSAAFSVPLPQSAPHAMGPQTQLHPTSMCQAPTAQSVSFAMQPPLQQQQQQQQPQSAPVLNLQPAPNQSIAEATLAAIQAQQVTVALAPTLGSRPTGRQFAYLMA